jgi:hypothetical protein
VIPSLVVLVIVAVRDAVVPDAVNPFRVYALVELLPADVIGVGTVVT